jgi:hypothetical protein
MVGRQDEHAHVAQAIASPQHARARLLQATQIMPQSATVTANLALLLLIRCNYRLAPSYSRALHFNNRPPATAPPPPPTLLKPHHYRPVRLLEATDSSGLYFNSIPEVRGYYTFFCHTAFSFCIC